MSAEEVLRRGEVQALRGEPFVFDGSKNNDKKKKILKRSLPLILVLIIIGAMALVFSAGNIIPVAISERLIEETDVQYADAVQSKILVFQQAMLAGEIPDDTAKNLKEQGVLVGYLSGSEFVEGNQVSGSLILSMGGEIITAENFVSEINNNPSLYAAFNNATYSRAAYYYDETAQKVFKEIGTSRNNYTEESELNSVVSSLIGSGSNINIDGVSEEKTDDGKTEYVTTGKSANSKSTASDLINTVSNKYTANTESEATLNAADSLKVADTISKEQRSSLFFLAFMENISKMKAGEGNSAKINETMNYLYESAESEVVDVETGEIIKTTGTPLESPSLYAILSGYSVNTEDVKNYSTDRTLKTVENKLNTNNATSSINSTVASTSSKITGAIGRLIKSFNSSASSDTLSAVEPTINSSLVENSYDTIKGINAGEFLVEGAINVGGKLAAASGGTVGDAESTLAYNKVTSNILAMDAVVDRMNRSPFDVTSKNTFLGSIVYSFAVTMSGSGGTIFKTISAISKTLSSAATTFLPSSYADNISGYLSSFGDCETYANIGAIGSAGCSKIITFDTSTLDNPYGDSGFTSFVENNTELVDGVRKIKDGSTLSTFVKYSSRTTPLGVVDGGILKSLGLSGGSIPFISDIAGIVKSFVGASEDEIRIANGAAFVNSGSNTDWQTYKYAQRYVALARAAAVLKQYSNDSTAYDNLLYFEGEENPVIAYTKTYLASK